MTNVHIRLNEPVSMDMVDMVNASNSFGLNNTRGTILDRLDRRISNVGKTNSLGVLSICVNDTLVGFSLPGLIGADNFQLYQIDESRKWYRFGACYIKPEYRNKGYMKQAVAQFKEQFPNLVWIADVKNLPSIGVATHNGLVLSHNMYWSESTIEDHYNDKTTSVDNIYKTP